jgi:hypothetical protein
MDDAEGDLKHTFQTAARSVTNLFRASQNLSRTSYNRGYEQALQDLLQLVEQRLSTTHTSNINGADLVRWARSKHADLDTSVPIDGSTPSGPLFGSDALTGYVFNPLLNGRRESGSRSEGGTAASSAVGTPNKRRHGLTFLGLEVDDMDLDDRPPGGKRRTPR